MFQHPDFTIKKEIGQGGMATVYLAQDHIFRCDVAIKVLSREFVFNEHIRNRFLDEARKLYKLNHPNIIKVTRLIEQNEDAAFVMEFLDGQTLKEYLDSSSKLSNDEIKKLFLQMIDAIQYVHEQGLVHRDIKPSNFMITPQNTVKLLDFGIAKNADNKNQDYTQTSATYQMGTPMYMSPEQINEARNVTSQSDLYSLGIVLWQMVMGEKPYDSNSLSTFQLLSKIVNEELVSTNSSFQPIIDKLTCKNPKDRYANCIDIKADLLKVQSSNDETIRESQNVKKEKKKQSDDNDATKFVNFGAAKSENSVKEKQKKKKYILISAGLLISLFVIMFITGVFSSKENKPDGSSDNTVLEVSNPSPPVITTIISDTNIIDTTNYSETPEVVLPSNNPKIIPKQVKKIKKEAAKTTKVNIQNTTADVVVTAAPSTPVVEKPSSPTVTVTPEGKDHKKSKFKIAVDKVKGKVNKIIKKINQ